MASKTCNLEYQIVSSHSESDLSRTINELMKMGWTPYKGLTVCNDRIMQVVVRKKGGATGIKVGNE